MCAVTSQREIGPRETPLPFNTPCPHLPMQGPPFPEGQATHSLVRDSHSTGPRFPRRNQGLMSGVSSLARAGAREASAPHHLGCG